MKIKLTLLLCCLSVFLASGCTKNPSSTAESQIKAHEAAAQLAPKAKEAAPSPQVILEQAYAKLSDDSNITSEEIHTENFGKPPPSEAAPALARQVDATSTFTYKPEASSDVAAAKNQHCNAADTAYAAQSEAMYRRLNQLDESLKVYEDMRRSAQSSTAKVQREVEQKYLDAKNAASLEENSMKNALAQAQREKQQVCGN